MASAGKSQRVLIIVENLPVPFDRRVWLEANALKDAGYQVSVICPKMKGFTKAFEILNGIRIYRHPLPYEAVSGAFGFLIEYSVALFFETLLSLYIGLRHGIDIIHACNPPDTVFIIGKLMKLFGVRFIFDQHDINPELYIAKYNRTDFFYNLLVWLERQTYRTADTVISTNQSYREIALTRGEKDPDDVFIVRSAPDIARFYPVTPDPHLKQDKPFMVAYLGVMGKQEGIDLLLESIRILVMEWNRTDIQFVLVGGGPELPNLINLASQFRIQSCVTFTGRISDAELLTVLSTADLCVNPDRVNEMNDKSTMNKIMEYMAIGKPIVQFNTTEGRYSAQEASVYANPNDPENFARHIAELLANPEQRKKMGDFGLNRMRNELDWKYSVTNLLSAYRHVSAPGKP